jgi:NhaP-type Na+/H+ or K+/H+ antiporter
MEFQITKKAKNVAFGLIGSGAFLTIIGIALTASDHHFNTRFLASGLIFILLGAEVRNRNRLVCCSKARH